MCIGIPMQVLEGDKAFAVCESDKQREVVDMRLIGPQPEGTWILVFLGAAREVLDAERAKQISNALDALQAVQQGQPIDHLFADLIDREPQLPDFLQPNKTGK